MEAVASLDGSSDREASVGVDGGGQVRHRLICGKPDGLAAHAASAVMTVFTHRRSETKRLPLSSEGMNSLAHVVGAATYSRSSLGDEVDDGGVSR